MKKYSTAFISLLLTAAALATPVPAFAQIKNEVIGRFGTNEAAASDGSLFATVFVYFWRALIVVGALLVIFFFVSGAIDYITAGGEKGKTEAARSKITTAVIGFVILLLSFTIISVIGNFLGFSLLKLSFPNPGGTTTQVTPSTPQPIR